MIHFDIANLQKELNNLEKKTNNPNFWSNPEESTPILAKIKEIKSKLDNYKKIETELINLESLNKLLLDEYDKELAIELFNTINNLEKDIAKLELKTLLSAKYDKNNAILTLHPGAGGTESQDWVEMLYRMYCKWATANEYSIKELDFLEGDEAGIKSVTFLISGDYAYGYLKGEMGVHRLVRISPFDSGRKKAYIFCFFRSITRNYR